MTDQGKNNTRIVLAALAIVTTVVTLVIAPLVRGNSSNAEILQRLARLEECTRKIEFVPERVAALTEATSGLRVSIDRLEKKLDSHVEKGK
jgi:hypothetical protein